MSTCIAGKNTLDVSNNNYSMRTNGKLAEGTIFTPTCSTPVEYLIVSCLLFVTTGGSHDLLFAHFTTSSSVSS